MSDEAVRALAQRFFDAIEQGDIDGVIACYAADAAIWHNTDGQTQGPEDNRRVLTGMVKYILDRRYDDRRLTVFSGGFVQQHVLRGTRRVDGGHVALPACIVCAVQNGRITRLDEYFDSAGAAEFVKAAGQLIA